MNYRHMFTNLGKICITGLLFYFLFQQIDASNVYLYLKSFSLTAIYLSILSVLFSTIVTSWRWHFILKSVGYDIPIKNCTTQIFKCYSISQFMPSNIGGDIYRIIALKPAIENYQYATLLVVLDRAIGMIAMLTVCIITSILSAPEALKQYVFPALKSITLALPVMILGMYFIVTALKKKSDFLMQVNRYVKAILTSRHLLKIIGYGGLVPLLYCAPAYILALDLGLDVSLNAFLSILTFITVISAVPISVAGWGVREGLMVFLLGFYGLSQEIAISLSIMIGIINLCAAIPGMFLFLDFKHMGLNHVKSKV